MFNRDLKISQGEKWDLSQVSKEELSKKDVTKDKNKLIKIFNTFNINGGESLDDVELLKAMDYFGKLDTDGDGKLSKDELAKGAEYLNEQLSLTGKDELKSRDLKNFIKNIVKSTDGNETVNARDMFTFDDGELDIQNVSSSRVEENNGVRNTVLTYEDGREVTTNPGGNYHVKNTDENGTVTTQFFSADNHLQKETSVYSNNDTEVTDFDLNGQPVKNVSVTSTASGQMRSELLYKDGKESSEYITYGNTVEEYSYINDEPVLQRKVQNKGLENESITTYTYNDETGAVTEKIKEGDKITRRFLDSNNVLLKEQIDDGLNQTDRIYNSDGTVEETAVTTTGVSTTVYDADGNRLSQHKTVGGRDYNVEYDGNGNTRAILQSGESPEALADKFGCTKEELLDANGGKIRGWAGDDVLIPGELEADDARLQNRQTKEEAIADYVKVSDEIEFVEKEAAARKTIDFENRDYDTFDALARKLYRDEGVDNPSKRQLKRRIEDLKEANPDLKDGELKGKTLRVGVSPEIFAEKKADEEAKNHYAEQIELRTGADTIAAEFYDIAVDNSGNSSMTKMKELLDTKVTKDNIMYVLDAYDKHKVNDSSLIDTITSEVGAGANKQKEVLTTVLDTLCEAAVDSGVSEEKITKARTDFTNSMDKELSAVARRTNPKDMEKAIDFLRGAIAAKQVDNVKDIADKEAIDAFNEDFSSADADAQKLYKDARDEEGWMAKAGDTVCGWFGCNTIEEMDEKLGKNADDVKRLASAKDETEFKAIYKEIFGINFDKNVIAQRDAALGNYQQAKNLESAFNISKGLYDMRDAYNYSQFRGEIKTRFELNDDTVDSIINSYSADLGIDASTDDAKKQILTRFLEDTQNNSKSEYQKITKGKSLEQMEKELDLITKSAFGTNDIVKDVIQFNENQQITEMATTAAFEIAGTIALQFVPGLGQAAAARLAITSAKWGSKGVKLASYAQKAEKAIASARTFTKGNALRQGVSNVVSTGTATAVLGASDGKEFNEITKRTLMNMSFAGVGASSSVIAPKLMKSFGITNKALANEIAEEIMNAAGSYGITTLSGADYGQQDAFIDFASGIILSRLGHVKTAKHAETSSVNADTSLPVRVEQETPQVKVDTDYGVDITPVHDDGSIVITDAEAVSPYTSAIEPPAGASKPSPFDNATTNHATGEAVTKNSVGKINEEKFEGFVEEVKERVPDASDAELQQLKDQADALLVRDQSRTLKHIVEDEQMIRNIADETNLGELHALEKRVSGWSDSSRDKQSILDAIEEQRNQLIEDNSFTVNQISIAPEVRENALNALEQMNRKLNAFEQSAVKEYLQSITNPDEFISVVQNLKVRKQKFKSEANFKKIIDKKAAELNITPERLQSPVPVKQEDTSPLKPEPEVTVEAAPAVTHTEMSPTPVMDRIAKGSGRVARAKQTIVRNEVAKAIETAATEQQLQDLRQRVDDHIANEYLRAEFFKNIDDAIAKLH